MSSAFIFGSLLDIKNKRDYLEYFIHPIKLNRDGNDIVLIFNFDINNKIFDIEKENITEDKAPNIALKYLWVGNTPDTTNRYLTTNNIKRIIDGINIKLKNQNPIIILYEKIKNERNYENLKDLLDKVIEIFFPDELNHFLNISLYKNYKNYIDNLWILINQYKNSANNKEKNKRFKEINNFIKFLNKKEEKQNWIENIKKKDDISDKISNILKYIQDLTNKAKTNEKIKKEENPIPIFEKLFSSITNVNLNNFSIVSLKINNKLISENEDYLDYLYHEKSTREVNNKNKVKRLCDLCQEEKYVSSEILKKAWIKFFITDKQIFSSNLSKKFEKNFSICDDCFIKLTLGEKYLLKNFNQKWANKNVLIVPQFSLEKNIDLNYLTEEISDINNYLYNYNISDLNKFEKKINDFFYDTDNKILFLDYIFYSLGQGGKPNKINKFIRSVNPSRIHYLLTILKKLNYSTLVPKPKWNINLNYIYYCIPVKIDKKGEMVGGQFVLDLFESILLEIPFNKKNLIEKFVETLKIIYFNKKKMNVSNKNQEYKIKNLIQKSLMMDLCLLFLEEINSLNIFKLKNNKEAKLMSKNGILKEFEKYWENKSVYNHPHAKAMFLLGYLIGEIGSAQFQKGLKDDPILNKINFDGMNKRAIIYLFNEVGKMLKNYKIMKYNTSTYEASKNLFDYDIPKNINELSDIENVYFILGGYAYKKAIIIQKFKEKKNSKEIT
ncbi:MAG: type I-B CRISPR-associated protein Cas8b/Csh1 [Promethearchaeota archaeon]